jgi:hypothetical protein
MSEVNPMNYILKYLTPLIALTWLSSGALSAQELWLDVHLLSNHSADYYYDGCDRRAYDDRNICQVKRPFNENNLGLGLGYELNRYVELGVGFYENSYYNTSVYAGGDVHIPLVATPRGHVKLGAAIAFVTGYENTPTQTPILFLPTLTVGNEHVRAKIGFAPVGEVTFYTLSVGISIW